MPGQHVLIIDDELPVRVSISAALKAAGYATSCASNRGEALQLIEENPPDLVICDVYMADGDGFDTLAHVRARPGSAALPFILITGRFEPAIMRRGMDLGADDFLIKPFSPKQLVASVHARLNRIEVLQDNGEVTRRRLLAMLDEAPVLIGMCDERLARFEFINRAGRDLAGIATDADIASLALTDLFTGEGDAPLPSDLLDRITETGTWSGDAVLRVRDGRHVPVALILTLHAHSSDTAGFISIIARDVTSSWHAARALRQSEARLRSVMENAAESICVLDLAGRQVWSNPGFAHAIPTAAENTAGVLFVDQVHPDDRTIVSAALARACETGLSGAYEYRVQPPDGAVRCYEAHASRIADEDGRAIEIIHIARDVTQRKEAERERDVARILLHQAQKLESIGRLAAGIAHEINTPTQFVGDNIRFLRDAFGDIVALLDRTLKLVDRAATVAPAVADEANDILASVHQLDVPFLRTEIPACLEQCIEGIQRLSGIVNAMKEFSHPGPVEKSPVNLNRTIESTTVVARNEWKYVADMVLDFDPQLGPVPCIAGEFNQVILNLIVNGAHAIAEKCAKTGEARGTIKISTRRVGRWAEIRVSDTGTGIPEEVSRRIFEPFFTTKPVGRGTGQGLAIARSVVVEKHGGELTFETTPGAGTCFIIRLPLQESPVVAVA